MAVVFEPFLPLAVAEFVLGLAERFAEADSALNNVFIGVAIGLLDCGELGVDASCQVSQ